MAILATMREMAREKSAAESPCQADEEQAGLVGSQSTQVTAEAENVHQQGDGENHRQIGDDEKKNAFTHGSIGSGLARKVLFWGFAAHRSFKTGRFWAIRYQNRTGIQVFHGTIYD
jgi:hypothetical protein